MKKINNKGFLLVETLVVSTFCLTVLVILFLQFKNLVISYNNSYKYNTVEGIYSLKAVKDYLKDNNKTLTNTTIITTTSSGNTVCTGNVKDSFVPSYCDSIIADGNFKTIIYLKDTSLSSLKSSCSYNEGLCNFIRQLNTKNRTHRLIAEFNDETYASITYN